MLQSQVSYLLNHICKMFASHFRVISKDLNNVYTLFFTCTYQIQKCKADLEKNDIKWWYHCPHIRSILTLQITEKCHWPIKIACVWMIFETQSAQICSFGSLEAIYKRNRGQKIKIPTFPDRRCTQARIVCIQNWNRIP